MRWPLSRSSIPSFLLFYIIKRTPTLTCVGCGGTSGFSAGRSLEQSARYQQVDLEGPTTLPGGARVPSLKGAFSFSFPEDPKLHQSPRQGLGASNGGDMDRYLGGAGLASQARLHPRSSIMSVTQGG
ncbi:hypothetical protein VTK26DRAFT_7680 [Humicola hyalothermophila]